VAQQIVIDIVAETKKLTQGLDDTNKELGSVQKNLKAATKTAVAFASAFVLKQGITFLKQGIDEAKEAQEVMRRATTTFGEGSKALEQITKDAEEFGKALAIDNDELIDLGTQLGSRLPDDIKASSVQLVKIFKDVEAFTGGAVSAESAGAKLAKAFADGKLKATELQKIFPGLNASIYEQAEALSEAGKNQEAVNLLVDEGAKKYGDAAAKNATSTQKFEVALANFKEELGTKVLPILEKGIDFLTKMLEAFDKLPAPVQNFSLGLLALVGIGGPLVSFVSNTTDALRNLGLMPPATGAATTGINLFNAALKAIAFVAIISLIVLLIQNWDDVTKKAKEVWEAVNKWFGKVYDDIKEFVDKAIDWLKENWPKILAVLTGPFGLFVAFLVNNKDEIIAKLKEAWETITTKLDEWVGGAIKVVSGWFNALRDFLAGLFTKGKDTIFSVIEDGWNLVKDTILNILDFLIIDIAKKWLEIGLTITNNITQIVKGVIEKFTEMKDKAVEQFNKLKDAASKIWDSIKGFITDVATKIREKLGEVFGFMVEVGKDIARGIAKGLSDTGSFMRTFLTEWVNNNILKHVKTLLGIKSPSTVMMDVGKNMSQGLSLGLNTVSASTIPSLSKASTPAVNITINAGLGTDPVALGREVQKALRTYGKYNIV
jgi:hypothetical protein